LFKLIRRASQVKNLLYELNNKERKRIKNEHDYDEPTDPALQQLRVLPPDIKYPDIANYPDFYDQIGYPHLADKYPPEHLKAEVEARIRERELAGFAAPVAAKTGSLRASSVFDKNEASVSQVNDSVIGESGVERVQNSLEDRINDFGDKLVFSTNASHSVSVART